MIRNPVCNGIVLWKNIEKEEEFIYANQKKDATAPLKEI